VVSLVAKNRPLFFSEMDVFKETETLERPLIFFRQFCLVETSCFGPPSCLRVENI